MTSPLSNDPSKVLSSVLNAMEQVVLEVVDEEAGTVRVIEGDSQWVRDLFPDSKGKNAFTIDENIPFLLDFLIDGRLIWRGKENTRIRSGFWTEIVRNKALHLEAIAIKYDLHNLLIISNQAEEFTFRQTTLQSARELLQHNDRLVEQNEYLHERLLAILKKTNSAK